MADTPIINKVAQSGLITLNLEKILPPEPTFTLFDLKDYLFKGLILREKEFRGSLKSIDWSAYQAHWVAITCSTDAIIPHWAYMLVASYLQPYATKVIMGNEETIKTFWVESELADFDVEPYKDQRLIIKGCGEKAVPTAAYLSLTRKLIPVAKSVMYGEPCSTVPIFKKK